MADCGEFKDHINDYFYSRRWSCLLLSFVEIFWSFYQFGKMKKLRSLPPNQIIVSMALANLLVGVVVCPLMVYWGWDIFKNKSAGDKCNKN